MSADSIALSTIRNILVSSANNLTWDLILSTISFIYNKKRRGYTIDLCGTSAFIYCHDE
jgi:hypothetical protein